jgi:hypothetical protein
VRALRIDCPLFKPNSFDEFIELRVSLLRILGAKKMRFATTFAALVLTSSPALAREYAMQLQPSENQQERVASGVEALDSIATSSTIRFIEPNGPFKKRGTIEIFFVNSSPHPFNVGPENVTAQLDDGTIVPIIGYEQLAREERHRQGWAAFGAALAAASNSTSAANAGNTYGTATYSGNTYGNVGGYGYQSRTYGTANYQAYDATAAAIAGQTAQRQNEAIFARLADSRQAGNVALAESFRTTTVDPNGVFGGQVTFELPAKARSSKTPVAITFTVGAGEDRHIVKAIVQKVN